MTNGEFMQSVSMERLATICSDVLCCPPDGNDFRPECEFMPDKCAECWKRWLLTEREGETDD